MKSIATWSAVLIVCVCQVVQGENRRLVCKTAEVDFTDGVDGEKDNGEKYVMLNASIESIGDRVIKNMQTMERRIMEKFQKSLSESKEDLEGLQDAIIYRGRRFWVILFTRTNMIYEEAELFCRQRGGRPADVLKNDDIYVFNEHIIATMETHVDYATIWLGMRFDQITKEIRYYDGDTAPNFRWHPGHPSLTSSRTGVVLATRRNRNDMKQGILLSTLTSNTHGVLCQK